MSSSTFNFKLYRNALLITFIAMTVTAVALTEYTLRTKVLPHSPTETLKSRLQNSVGAIAAFGDSRVAHGFPVGGDVVNLGHHGANLSTVLALASHYVEENKPSAIILQAAPQQFALYRLGSDQRAIVDDLLGRKVAPLAVLRPEYRQYLMQYIKSIITEPAKLFENPAVASETGRGLTLASLPPKIRSRKASIRVQLQIPIDSFSESGAAKYFLNSLARLKQHVAVCLVAMPVSTDYRKAAAVLPEFARVQRFYASAAKSLGIRYVDLSRSLPDTAFSDPDHVNGDGAEILAKQAVDRCGFAQIASGRT